MVSLLAPVALLGLWNVWDLFAACEQSIRDQELSQSFTLRRAVSEGLFESGAIPGAIECATRLFEDVTLNAEQLLIAKLDLARYQAAGGFTEIALQRSRQILFQISIGFSDGQVRAIHRRLEALDLTHFPYEMIEHDAFGIEVKEPVGVGTYAIVESIRIGSRLYARKSIALPRQRHYQVRIREAIQNEISVIRALRHPHIVRVYFTYEEKTRFSIVLEPLAECDLGLYLHEQSNTNQAFVEEAYRQRTWRWLQCLAKTVHFMHSKGIRHKDIKTSNILVHGEDIIFADFGSSHAFLDHENSTTEGPSFGHTVMYCAPEVIANAKRNRSADIFSLGCVYAELVTSMDARSLSDFADFRMRVEEDWNTIAYHATLDKVAEWFTNSNTTQAAALYDTVISPMLERIPRDRATTKSIIAAIQKCYQDVTSTTMESCPKCSPFCGKEKRAD